MSRSEIKAAMNAGDRVLYNLHCIKWEIQKTKHMGKVLSTIIRYLKIKKVRNLMKSAKMDLRHFERIMERANVSLNLRKRTENYISFAKIYFDEFLKDYPVYKKIFYIDGKLSNAIIELEYILLELKERM